MHAVPLLLLPLWFVSADGLPWFDIQSVGIEFRYHNGMNGQRDIIEVMGAGCGWIDFDRDGDLDAYLVQGGDFRAMAAFSKGSQLPASSPGDRLFRNDWDGQKLRFKDVTVSQGIVANGYGMGVAVGDVNNDGWPDLYLLNYGTNQLLLNRGGTGFDDVTAAWGVGDQSWSVSASFFDYDRDGDLDLFVTNYLRFNEKNRKRCLSATGLPEYCGPDSFPDAEDRLYANLGNRFVDVTSQAGLMAADGAGLGCIVLDANRDGWLDVYVANDADPNQLWINGGDGTFMNRALMAGVALNDGGVSESGMGVDLGDLNGDGEQDLFVTHLTGQTHTLYIMKDVLWFEDQTTRYKIAGASREATGFGTALVDFDRDGWIDVFVANGAAFSIAALRAQGDPFPLGQANQLFANQGGRGFLSLAQPWLAPIHVSRGAAVGDVDNDGDMDLLVNNNNGPAQLAVNQAHWHHWIGFEIEGHDARVMGTRIDVHLGQRTLVSHVRRDGSYASARDPRVVVGLGQTGRVEKVIITALDGFEHTLRAPKIDQYHVVSMGAR